MEVAYAFGVTRGDIARGEPGYGDTCPIALAANRAVVDDPCDVSWGDSSVLSGYQPWQPVVIIGDHTVLSIRKAGTKNDKRGELKNWITAFDEGEYVNPIRVEIYDPEGVGEEILR